jgi:hypothetical protein
VSVSVSLGVAPKGKANRGSEGFGEEWKERGGAESLRGKGHGLARPSQKNGNKKR